MYFKQVLIHIVFRILQNEGHYLVSMLVIDEVQEADFGAYFFTAENVFDKEMAKNIYFTKGMKINFEMVK